MASALKSTPLSNNVQNCTQNNVNLSEWNSKIASNVSLDGPPELVAPSSPPITYTTVGSLVNPRSIKRLAAPNRIQREGANRRPLMSILENQTFDSAFQSHESPRLKISNRISSSQQVSWSPSEIGQVFSPSVSEPNIYDDNLKPQIATGPSIIYNISIEQEQDKLNLPSSGNIPLPYRDENAPVNLQIKDLNNYNINEIAFTYYEKEGSNPSEDSSTHLHGMEKMQTLQRLSKFNNPMQDLALNKLSEFSFEKRQEANNINCIKISPPESYLVDTRNATRYPKISGMGSLDIQKNFSRSGKEKDLQSSIWQSSNTIQDEDTSLSTGEYIQPLTAGPPGPRQSNINLEKRLGHRQDISANKYRTMSPGMRGTFMPKQPQSYYQVNSLQNPEKYHQESDGTYGNSSQNLIETISWKDAARYYPYSIPYGLKKTTWPLNMNDSREKMYLGVQKVDGLNDWFYSGYRNFCTKMTQVMDNKSNKDEYWRKNYEHSASSEKNLTTEKRQLLVGEVQKTPMTECAAPMIECLLRTMLEYSDRRDPQSRAVLSKYTSSPLRYIDITSKGSRSLFSENFGNLNSSGSNLKVNENWYPMNELSSSEKR
ncbi:BgTH12-04599 [Blumeria graminis f. sp. triticale]|uniref:Bgt-4323 n=3 Tax=Blumeria graminis TaxID=34373 RepID=A0A9X9L816_BLUGR|nr:hypothetical protein BGT96224_4323 [Blumeria graminis f. sp. tritici 96224]CAD6498944.1 BgTH12-04599 [Blumeria graminis f. sp. triticale]VCU39064.1 Bgt-4323 [Blumeria graminis f. sp. tritici]